VKEEPASEPDWAEPVAAFRDGIRAQLCVMALQAGGVEAWLSQPYLTGLAPDLGLALGVEVLVGKSDAPAARELIVAFESGNVALPVEATVCPRCASPDSHYVSRPCRAGAILGTILLGYPRPDVAWMWQCVPCGHVWR
jgi:hypothetical protein